MLRVLIDTNLFVSGLISNKGAPHELMQLWLSGVFALIISADQREEIAEVLSRPLIVQRYRVYPESRERLLQLLDSQAVRVEVSAPPPIHVRDAKDEFILAAAVHGGADYLATGDEDLLVLDGQSELGSLRIVTARQLVNELLSPK